ncbi:hypothetical protein [Streptomyces afghaniensis]|uniref:hypothetical protein n=1 Tax=Streptomyces afghaniensis TaxID=66865 RepID=UPI0037B8FF70
MPAEEEIRRVRRLIERVQTDLDNLTPEDRAQIEQAVTVVRRSRTVMLGMPRVHQPHKDRDVTSPINDGRVTGTERRRRRVQDAITTAVHHGTPLTASAIARAAGVDRTFLYRHRDLLEHLHTTGSRCAETSGGGPAATQASLQADLANANARAARLVARVQQLEAHLPAARPTGLARVRTRRLG